LSSRHATRGTPGAEPRDSLTRRVADQGRGPPADAFNRTSQMEHAYQLSTLAGLIAALRAQGRTVRLALHNTERFGLIHLYFAHGRLIRVDGHAGDPARNLLDLASWRYGAVRVDHVEPPTADAASPAALEAELNQVLAELERREVVHPAPPSVYAASAWAARSPSSAPTGTRLDGLPPLPTTGQLDARFPPLAAEMWPEPEPEAEASADRLTDPEWQLLALAVHQVTERAGQLLGGAVAESMVRHALAQLAADNAFLAGLDLDSSGWLRTRAAGLAARFTTFEVVEAVAALLSQVELRAASVIGPQRAQQLIAQALTPFRASLEQIGLIIRAE
jgi:hypothetical protein